MDFLDSRTLKARAGQLLDNRQPSARFLALLHFGAALGVSLVLNLLQLFLSRQIDNTGGLSGLQTRSILATAQTVLQYASMILMPVWQLGFAAASMQWARGHSAAPQTLLTGFHRFWGAIRLFLLRTLAYVLFSFLCVQIGILLLLFMPTPASLDALLGPVLQDAAALEALTADTAAMEAMAPQILEALLPYLAVFGVLYAVAMLLFSYRLRLADFLFLDNPESRALPALLFSAGLMKGRWKKLFLLDLRFWWYYAANALLTIVCYGDTLLELAGIPLPMSADAAFVLFYCVYLVGYLLLNWLFAGHVQTANALFFDTLKENLQTPPPPKPTKVPWDYETEQ